MITYKVKKHGKRSFGHHESKLSRLTHGSKFDYSFWQLKQKERKWLYILISGKLRGFLLFLNLKDKNRKGLFLQIDF